MLNVRFELEPASGSTRSGRGGLILAAALAAAVALAFLINSVATGADSRIHACVGKKSGAVRIVAAGKRCKKGERRVTWQRVGPVGAPGTAGSDGATGPQGATGTTGAPGVDDFNDLEGLPCTRNAQQGTVDLAFGPGGLARARCSLPAEGAICGDGVIESGENCDDGNDNPTDSCTNQCSPPACGDSVVQSPEQCDAAGMATATCDTQLLGCLLRRWDGQRRRGRGRATAVVIRSRVTSTARPRFAGTASSTRPPASIATTATTTTPTPATTTAPVPD